MSEKTNIEWANHTGGPWLICSMVSAGCKNCYAMILMLTRLGPLVRKAYKAAGFEDWETRPIWGDKATRVLSKGFWKEARRINAMHAKAGTRGRWFPSMIDFLDTMPAGIIDQDGNKLDPIAVLADLLKLIHNTPNLDWLLLTKRPENFIERLELVLFNESIPTIEGWLDAWVSGTDPANVWIGTSVEDQARADERIPLLLQIPAKVRFLSVEPLLEPVNLGLFGTISKDIRPNYTLTHQEINWVIVGGESGKDRRDCGVEAILDVVGQTVAACVPCFVKQDSAFKPGQQGRIPDDVWALKQFPKFA